VAFITTLIPRLIYAIYFLRLYVTYQNTYSHAADKLLYAGLPISRSIIVSSPYVRRRYLSEYERCLWGIPLDKPTVQKLYPKNEELAPFHNHLNEFLQAARVFDFLERQRFPLAGTFDILIIETVQWRDPLWQDGNRS